MKRLFLLFMLISLSVYADDCVFDEKAYLKFIQKYSAENNNSTIKNDGETLLVNRNNESILVKGGGCNHLGVSIEVKTKQAYTERQFLQKVLSLSREFGNWLINTRELKNSIEKGKYQIINNVYYIKVDAMTVFTASNEKPGEINIDFYIN